MTFDDLQFADLTHGRNDAYIVARAYFPNGYGASVIKGPTTIGGRHGLYEVALLKGTRDHNAAICYTAPDINAINGDLTPDDVTALLGQIEALAPVGEAGK